MRPNRATAGLVTAVLVCCSAAPASAQIPIVQQPTFFQRSDITFALVSTAAVLVTGHNDLWIRSKAIEANSQGDQNLAKAFEPFGNPAYVLPGLLVGYGIARMMHAPQAATGITEIGISVLTADAAALVLKEAVGRARPEDSPDDNTSFDPFSGNVSFPSGHATTAFSLAESVNLTSGSRWAPWLTYPIASLVGWSRVRDDKHWASDVVAGAALGIWTARKVHRMLPSVRQHFAHLELSPFTPAGAPGLAVSLH